MADEIEELKKQLERYEWDRKKIEKPDEQKMFYKEISAAHPMEGGDTEIYDQALALVGERHAKYDLVDLVNWLLHEHRALRTLATDSVEMMKRNMLSGEMVDFARKTEGIVGTTTHL